MRKRKQNLLKTLMILNLTLVLPSLLFSGTSLRAKQVINSDVSVILSWDEDLPLPEVTLETLIEESIVKPPSDPNEIINSYISEICILYPNVGQALIKSIVYHESRYNPLAKNGNCVGLMQVSTYWHRDRASRLGVTDFYDSYSNILLGVDYISELLNKYKDPVLVLMLYNMDHQTALKLSRGGVTSTYARSVLAKAEEYKKGEL